MARSSRTQLFLVVEGQDNTGASLTAAAAKIDQLEKRAKEADQAMMKMGGGMGQIGANTDRFSVSLARLASQSTGLSGAFQLLGTEGAGLISGTAALASGVVGLGVAAAAAAWDLGAAALKADAVALRGKDARTSVDNLATAFNDLKIEVGRSFAPAVDEVANSMTVVLARAAGDVQLALEAQRNALLTNRDAFTQQALASQGGTASLEDVARVAGLATEELRILTGMLIQLDEVQRKPPVSEDTLERMAQHAIDLANALLNPAIAELANNPAFAPDMMRDFQDYTAMAQAWQPLVDDRLKAADKIAEAELRAGDRAALAWENGFKSAAGRVLDYINSLQDRAAFMQIIAPNVAAMSQNPAFYQDPMRDYNDYTAMARAWQPVVEQRLRDAQIIKEAERRNADEAARAWQAAFTAKAGEVSNILGNAISAANNLRPNGPIDPFAPGANGPFEKIYRAMDVLKQGGASPWAGEFAGMSQEQLAKAVGDFQKGIMSEAAKSLIDMPMLVDQIRMQEMAETSRTAFANALAAAAGANPETTTAIVSSFFGGKDTKPTEAAVTSLADSTVLAMSEKNEQLETAGSAWLNAILTGAQSEQEKTVTGMTAIFDAIIAEVLRRMGQPVKNGQSSKGQ